MSKISDLKAKAFELANNPKSTITGELAILFCQFIDLAGSGENVQADYAQTDSEEPDYIKNKPTIPITVVTSSKTSFSSDSDLTKAECATALGVTTAQLDALFAGTVLVVKYGTDAALSAVVLEAGPEEVKFANVTVSVSTDTYAVTVS